MDLLREALYDKFIDTTGMMDFRKGAKKSKQNEAKRFLAGLSKFAQVHQKEELSLAEIYSVADSIELQVEDIRQFIDDLNDAGWAVLQQAQMDSCMHQELDIMNCDAQTKGC